MEDDDWTRCDHDERNVRVANESQKDEHQKHMPLRMARVCARRECVLDALAWVERGTHERAFWRMDDGDWRSDIPDLAVSS